MKLAMALIAGPQAAEVMQPGEAALDHPALLAEPRAVFALTPSDQRLDPARAELASVLVVVIATVGEQPLGPPTRPAAPAGHRLEAIDQRQKLSHVVAISAGQRDRQRDAAGIGQQMVLGAGARAVDWRGAGGAPPCKARTWLPSIAAVDQSILPAWLSRRRSSR